MKDMIPQVNEALESVFGEAARRLARETGAVQRETTLTGADLARILVFGWMSDPHISREGLARMAGRLGVGVSGPAIQQRLTKETATFLCQLLQLAVQQVIASDPVALPLLARLEGVLIEDSSTLSLPPELAEVWRGIGNAQSQQTPAALKLQVQLDVLTGQLHGPLLQEGRAADSKTPLGASSVQAKQLRLADRGFWKLLTFEQIEQAEGYWLSYIHLPVALYDAQGQRLDLAALLRQQPERVGEYEVQVGTSARLPARLVVLRVPEEVARQRLEDLTRKAQRHGRALSAEQELLAGYQVVLTNLPATLLTVREVLVLMRVRWQIELLFKLWKSCAQIDSWRAKKPWAILCEVYAKLLGVVVQHWLLLVGCWHDAQRSLTKAAQEVRRCAHEVALALVGRRSLRLVLEELQTALAVGCRITLRRQRPSTFQLLSDPTLWEQALGLT